MIAQCKSGCWQYVKKLLFCVSIAFKSLVIVEVIMRQVGKNATCKMKSLYTMLVDPMRRNLHKAIRNARFEHFCQKGIDLHWVRCCVCCWVVMLVDGVGNGG